MLLPSPIPADRTHLITPEAVNLCQRMLTYEPEKRIAINEALRHPYFTSCLTCVPCEGAGEGDGGGGAGGEGDR